MLLTLDRYLLAQTARPMAATILVTLLALLAERALSVVDLVIGWRGSMAMIFEMLSYLIPHYMGLALPAAFFLGIMFAFSRLSREGELDAMRAGGFGLVQMVLPLLYAAFVLMLVHLFLVSHLQPYSRYAYRAAVHAVTNVSFQALLQPGRFITLGNSTYRVEARSEDGNSFDGLFLFSEDPERGGLAVTAKHGTIETVGPTDPLVLHLAEGVQQLVPASGARAANQPVALTLRFGKFTTDLTGSEPAPFRPRGEDEREFTLPELWAARGQGFEGIEPVEISAELNGRIVRSLSILVLPCLALPLALGRRRSQRSYGLLIGIVVLVGYNQIVKTGESLVDNGDISALLGLWLPFAVFTAGSVTLWLRTAWRVPDPGGTSRLDILLGHVSQRVRRMFAGQHAS